MSASLHVQARYRAVSSYQTRTSVFSRSRPEPSFRRKGVSRAAFSHTDSVRSPSTLIDPCSLGIATRLGGGRVLGSGVLSSAADSPNGRNNVTTRVNPNEPWRGRNLVE